MVSISWIREGVVGREGRGVFVVVAAVLVVVVV